mmetsp:Transcript_143285/g.445377  ORF Transcript_143285/g.445377 Transcript_143285/m.445377 type:complete len:213 (+) Transcript_143285:975-1613(+)
MVDAARQADKQPDLQLTVLGLRPRQARRLAGQELHHALVPLSLQHVRQEAGLAGERDELPKVVDGRPPQVVQVVRHGRGQPRVDLLRLRVRVVLDLAQDRLHAGHVVVNLLLQIRRQQADELLGLARGAPQDRSALPLHLPEALLLGPPQALIVRLVVVGQRDQRVLRHDQQHDAPEQLVEAGVAAQALGRPWMPLEAREPQDVGDPRRTEA